MKKSQKFLQEQLHQSLNVCSHSSTSNVQVSSASSSSSGFSNFQGDEFKHLIKFEQSRDLIVQ
jgi:hypothetical protein